MPRLTFILLLATVALCGCKHFDLRRPIPWKTAEEKAHGKPISVVGMWSDTVLHQADRKPMRGFGGRLMFYGQDDQAPVKVEGALVVYAFDESQRDPADARPTKKYIFPPDQFERHHSKSDLGHSYSFWLPWDEVGGEQKEISLIVRFQPKQGPVVIGQPSRQVLPGTRPAGVPPLPPALNVAPAGHFSQQPSAVHQAGYHQAVDPSGAGAVVHAYGAMPGHGVPPHQGMPRFHGAAPAQAIPPQPGVLPTPPAWQVGPDARRMNVETIPLPENWPAALPAADVAGQSFTPAHSGHPQILTHGGIQSPPPAQPAAYQHAATGQMPVYQGQHPAQAMPGQPMHPHVQTYPQPQLQPQPHGFNPQAPTAQEPPPAGRFAPPRPRVPGQPISRPGRGDARWPQSP